MIIVFPEFYASFEIIFRVKIVYKNPDISHSKFSTKFDPFGKLDTNFKTFSRIEIMENSIPIMENSLKVYKLNLALHLSIFNDF